MNARNSTAAGRTDLGPATILFATLAAIGLGAGVSAGVGGGFLLGTVGAAVAGLAVGGSLTLLQSSSLPRQTLGSCGFLGGLVLLAPTVAQAGLFAITGAVATGATAIALAPGSSFRSPVRYAIRSSLVSAALVAGVGLALRSGDIGVIALFLAGLHAGITSSPFIGFVSLQVLVIVAALFCGGAVTVLESVLPERVDAPDLRTMADGVTDLPAAVHYAYGGQVLLWFLSGTAAVFESTLVALGPAGAVIALGLTGGALHFLVGSVALLGSAVCIGAAIAPFARLWLEPHPLRTLALAAGGVIVGLAALAVGSAGPTTHTTPVWVLIGLLGGAFVVVELLVRPVIDRGWGRAWRHRTLGLGALGLFVTTVVAALAGLEAPFVFAGVAASIIVWDVGENALSMRRELGGTVDSRQIELVHAMGSALVGVVGVGIAGAAMYGLGTVAPPTYRWQAVVPVALALAAVVAFAAVLLGSGWAGPNRLRRRLEGRRLARTTRSALTHPIAVPVGASFVIAGLMVVTGGTEYAPLVFFVVVVGIPIALLVWLEQSADGFGDLSGKPPREPP